MQCYQCDKPASMALATREQGGLVVAWTYVCPVHGDKAMEMARLADEVVKGARSGPAVQATVKCDHATGDVDPVTGKDVCDKCGEDLTDPDDLCQQCGLFKENRDEATCKECQNHKDDWP